MSLEIARVTPLYDPRTEPREMMTERESLAAWLEARADLLAVSDNGENNARRIAALLRGGEEKDASLGEAGAAWENVRAELIAFANGDGAATITTNRLRAAVQAEIRAALPPNSESERQEATR